MTESGDGSNELYLARIDPKDLEFMRTEERRMVLEDVGLDPDAHDS